MVSRFWVESLAVGIEKFDEDHRAFFDYLDSIEVALKASDAGQALRLAQDFKAAAAQHDLEEAAFLERNAYPQMTSMIQARHTLQHDLGELVDLLQKSDPQTLEVAERMRHQLVVYLLRGDINYKSFVDTLRHEKRLVE